MQRTAGHASAGTVGIRLTPGESVQRAYINGRSRCALGAGNGLHTRNGTYISEARAAEKRLATLIFGSIGSLLLGSRSPAAPDLRSPSKVGSEESTPRVSAKVRSHHADLDAIDSTIQNDVLGLSFGGAAGASGVVSLARVLWSQ